MFSETSSQASQFEGWTRDRRAEIRQVAERQAQLGALPRYRALPWLRRVARDLGRAMVHGGMWLQSQARMPAQAER